MKSLLSRILLLFCLFIPAHSYAYRHLSPYSYCGGDPVNCVDPSGRDVVVLNYGYLDDQHTAILIQDENGKWLYYSINGNNVYFSGEHTGGREFNDMAVGSWESPQEFMNSEYNVRPEDDKGKGDPSVNNYGFDECYLIPSTPEQDEIMRNCFTEAAKTEYNLINNNCTTIVQDVLIKAGIPVSKPRFEPSYIPVATPYGIVDVYNGTQMQCDVILLPSEAFKSIKSYNPNGTPITK
ncbi:MAG: hypothetical protein NC098_06820 [Lachnoclostridium sp.]|nr:hypothetical protein [Lachnoclostridium sp.]